MWLAELDTGSEIVLAGPTFITVVLSTCYAQAFAIGSRYTHEAPGLFLLGSAVRFVTYTNKVYFQTCRRTTCKKPYDRLPYLPCEPLSKLLNGIVRML